MREHGGKIPKGVLRTVVPAAPDAWITALRRYGTMSFGEVAAAAIRLARDGFPMYPLMAASLKRHEADHRAWPSTRGDLSAERPAARSRRGVPPDRSRRLVAIHGRRGEGAPPPARPRGRARSGARRLLSRRHRHEDRRLHEGGGRAALGRGPRRATTRRSARPSAAALAISKSSPAAPGARGRSCCRPWPCSKAPTSRRSATTAPTTSTT